MTETWHRWLRDKVREANLDVSGEIVEQRLIEAREREEAVRIVLRAVVASQSRFGFDRTKFVRLIREEGQRTPNDGPEAVRHAVLNQEAEYVLRATR